MKKDNNETSLRQQFEIDSSMKIGYVSLNVTDIQTSLEFYQSILGFRVLGRPSKNRALLSSNGNASHLVELLRARDNDPTSRIIKRAGLYHFAILLPERKYLADMLVNLRENPNKVHFDGLADHLVSESIYIRDPDFNGIEIYRDRPTSEWNWKGGQIEIATLRLNIDDMLKESTEKGWSEMPTKTTIGHVHLHVRDLQKAMKHYHEILELNLTTSYPGAYFFAAGRYHHHIATNTWLGTDIASASPESVGLNHFSIELPNKDAFTRSLRQLSRYDLAVSDLSEGSVFVQDMDGIRIRLQHK
jgi:catechol 2,3-dioxygenase